VTETVDPVRAFREALPAQLRAQLHDTQRIAGLVTAATARGWPVPALTAECSRSLAGIVNAGGVITSRLEHCARHDPPVKASKTRPEWCGVCDPVTRHLLDENGYPAPERCGSCHPLNGKVHA
jgi:hypothetical protein